MTEIRSLRNILIDQLWTLLSAVEAGGFKGDSMGGYLGEGTGGYAYEERKRWERDPTAENRRHCAECTAMEIRAEMAILRAIADEAYEQATRELPLGTWGNMGTHELVHYARGRGVEPSECYERFEGFGNVVAGMGWYGWRWLATGEEVPMKELERILGFWLAHQSARSAAQASGAFTGRLER